MQSPDTESRHGTFLHRAPALLKLAAALVVLLAVALLPRHPDVRYLAPTALLLCLWPVARMPVIPTLRRLLLVEFFILGIALLSLLTPSTRPVFLAALIKSNLCVFTMLLLTWTTPFHEILLELRRLRLPAILLTTLALMCRYLPVLAEELRRMQRARASRTFSPDRRLAWHNLTTIIGRLFTRSADRAERIYLAMCARGWK
jgi:cobalt/nickel transport system permease protein